MVESYFAEQMELGYLDYKIIFSQTRWKKYKAKVDEILTADGRADLIVEC